MTAPNDLDINRCIRKVLVKHWVDLGRLFIRTTRGKVTVHGILDRITGTKENLTPAIVEAMLNEIERIHGIERLTIDFVNWKKNQGKWSLIEQHLKFVESKAQAAQHQQKIYDVDSESDKK
jgi:hypothetical protein